VKRYTQQDFDSLVRWHNESVPIKEQAARLGRTYADIAVIRQRLAKKGLIVLPLRPAWRPWTRQELWTLRDKLEQGWSYRKIAKHLKRTETSVVLKCRRRNERLTTLPEIFSARDVADLLGLGCAKTVTRWIDAGYLKAFKGGRHPRHIYRIHAADLWDMLQNESLWMAWEPARITDPHWREMTQELRAGKPRWVSAGEVARRFHVSINAVNQWAHKGFLPSVKYGNHWYRESDLATFVVPIDRGFSEQHRANIRAAAHRRNTVPEPPSDARVFRVTGATVWIYPIKEAA
jgi:hypothetical protein